MVAYPLLTSPKTHRNYHVAEQQVQQQVEALKIFSALLGQNQTTTAGAAAPSTNASVAEVSVQVCLLVYVH